MSKYLVMNLQLFAQNDGAPPDGAGNQPDPQRNPADPAQADVSPENISLTQSESCERIDRIHIVNAYA